MVTEEDLHNALKPYCSELGWIKFDEETATFEVEYKPFTLIRYIRKTIDNDLLIVIPKKINVCFL